MVGFRERRRWLVFKNARFKFHPNRPIGCRRTVRPGARVDRMSCLIGSWADLAAGRARGKRLLFGLSAYPLHRDLDPAADLIHDAGGIASWRTHHPSTWSRCSASSTVMITVLPLLSEDKASAGHNQWHLRSYGPLRLPGREGQSSDPCSSKVELVESDSTKRLVATELCARNYPPYTLPGRATSLTWADCFWVGAAGRTCQPCSVSPAR
jgi:hypothetical protein